MKKKIFIVFAIVAILCSFFFGYMHEAAHKEIFKQYGIESKIKLFSEFPNMVTISETSCPNQECILAHNLNEVVGYHLLPFYLLFVVGFLSIISLMEKRNETT